MPSSQVRRARPRLLPAARLAPSALPVRTYRNPLLEENCPDPAVLHAEGAYYLACTSGNARDAFPLRRSTDLVHWEPAGHLFPVGQRPAWARSDFWAPELHRVAGRYLAYFTARDRTGRLCIGVAVADQVTGPWTDLGRPLIRDDRVGMIDANYLQDANGQRYLYWKEDGNDLRPKERTPIYVQPLAKDGLSLTGERRWVLVNDREWEGDLVEGPWVIHRGRYYYMFYSGNAFFNEHYAVGVARSLSPLGPFLKQEDTVLRRDENWMGPGHGCVVRVPDVPGGTDYFVYHGYQRGRVGGRHPRMLLMDRIQWENGWPRINDGSPSALPQAAPVVERGVGSVERSRGSALAGSHVPYNGT
jgi:arabinan endo-1,5-alpha-L-arabinosidase